MGLTILGNSGPQFVSTVYEFDSKYGLLATHVYEGLEESLLPAALNLQLAGHRVSVQQASGPKYRMTVQTVQQQFVGSDGTDRYDFRTEIVEVDIRNHPNVIAGAVTADTLALWIKDISAAVAAGENLSGTVSTPQSDLYVFWARGGRTYPESRITLRRTRTRGGVTGALKPTVIPTVYKTAKLATVFTLPGAVTARLPADPTTTPSGTVWAWWLRTQETSYIPDLNRDEEVMEWVFAAWSTLTYTVVQ